MKLILVLGSPNFEDGSLSSIAKSRLEVCKTLYKQGNAKIALTGGFGAHFNTSLKPHAYYLKTQLIADDIPEQDIMALIESRHSVEDATLSKWMIEEYKPAEIIIVTSDYHYERAKVIFKAVFKPFDQFTFSLAPSTDVDPEILNPLIRHEAIALQDLIANGVRF